MLAAAHVTQLGVEVLDGGDLVRREEPGAVDRGGPEVAELQRELVGAVTDVDRETAEVVDLVLG